MGQLGRLIRIGPHQLSSFDAAPPRRPQPWTWIRGLLAAAGLSGRAFVIAAPAAWITLFFIVPLAVVFGISLATKQFGQPPYSDLLTTENGTVQLTLHLSNYLKLIQDSHIGEGFWAQFFIYLIVGLAAFTSARRLGKFLEPQATAAIYGVAAVAATLFIGTL